jgi:carbon storage regulator CsrA
MEPKKQGGLCLTRYEGEQIIVEGGIVITIQRVKGRQVRVHIVAPPDVRIRRAELAPKEGS